MSKDIVQAYQNLCLVPYLEFTQQAALKHAKQAAWHEASPFDPNSELYRRIGSTTFWAVQTALEIINLQHKMQKPVKAYIISHVQETAQHVSELVQDFLIRLGPRGAPQVELKSKGIAATAKGFRNGCMIFSEVTSQEEMVKRLWKELS